MLQVNFGSLLMFQVNLWFQTHVSGHSSFFAHFWGHSLFFAHISGKSLSLNSCLRSFFVICSCFRSFFDYKLMSSGHSLLATKLLSIVQDTMGVQLTVKELFQFSTVSSMSLLIEMKASICVLRRQDTLQILNITLLIVLFTFVLFFRSWH